MRLSWNEIRARAADFSREWAGETYEKAETQSFYNDFFDIFGVRRRKVASFEEPVKGLPDNKRGFIDLFWKGVLLVEHKSAGKDLGQAKRQALDYFPGLKDADLPRYLLVCDFQHFELYDLDERAAEKFALAELPDRVQAFSFIFGGIPREFKDEDPVNIEASELMGELHDALKESGYSGHDLERFLVRLVFCLFADDTGIFAPKGILADYVRERTGEDGADVGPKLGQLFEVLNTPEAARQKKLDEDLRQFPYVNGDLFAERLALPAFDGHMRKLLINACAFDWSRISPAIFGALFQSVMDKKKRRAISAHYTSEQNILKVIGPLFLDDLKAEFARLKERRDTGRSRALDAFQDKLAGLKCLDPACGCGNFLVIAYRELRQLENDAIIELRQGRTELFAEQLSKVDVDQFYGIEIEEFPARIAETALWMMDHIMNQRLSDALGIVRLRIPLEAAPTIVQADALEIDWSSVLKPEDCSYVFGNPPFAGSKYQSDAQRAQVHRIADLGRKKGTLDYVTCWFLKAAAYVNAASSSFIPSSRRKPGPISPQEDSLDDLPGPTMGPGLRRDDGTGESFGASSPRIGFVATNSITQGEQVAELWPLIFNRYHLDIAYAHRTFAWGSEARGKANVHVVIVGLAKRADAPASKRLFDYPDIKGAPTETPVTAISPYLFDAGLLADPHTVVRETPRPPAGYPDLIIGSKPIDGGHFIFDRAQRDEFLRAEPAAKPFLRPYVGSEEFINGGERWILALHAVKPDQLRAMPLVRRRVEAVRDLRAKSTSAPTRALANTPTLYHVNVVPEAPFLVIPKVSSERREYVPIGYLEPPTIPSDLVFVLAKAMPALFGLITSRMHMAWLRFIGGRLKSDYRYSIGLVYNPFPWPDAAETEKERIAGFAAAVLAARRNHPASTLADLYDPLAMPPDLRKAHRALDLAVDRLYRREPFSSDRARVEFLLARYEALAAPALALAAQAPKRGRRRA